MFGIPDLITKAIDNLSGQSTGLDDAIDRLNYLITTFILACFAIIIGTKQHFGQPIQCMTPPEFQSGWNEYVEDYCFIQNTFVHPQDVPLLRPANRPNALYLSYYQWVPFIFLAQALLFYFPNFIWQALQTQTGMDLQTVVAEAKRLRTAFGKDRQEGTVSLMAYIEDCLRCGSRGNKTNDAVWPRFGRSSGTSSASVMYLFIKLCYLTNVVVQFFLINQIIGSNHAFWGWEMLGDVYKGRTTVDSGWFPRVTLCDFVKRENGNTHNHTVQCVLMVNMMNEKLFLFLWFWFLFVALCVLLSLVYLFATLVSSYFRERRVLQYLS
uniref:Innexin n=1 Tax=Plectus sambesii TaxID=2011161 RepID=A0A914X2A5_9BILA